MSFSKLLYTLLLCCALTIGSAQTNSIEFNNIHFNHLDKNSGLPSDMVWKVFEDSKGFLWIGTHNGLTRWDGLNFQHFQPNPADSTAIMGTTILDITEDKQGQLWFLVHNKGLSCFDPNTETFKNFRHQPHLKGLMRMKNFEDGYLWLGAYGSGMFRYEIATDKLTLLPLKAHFDDAEDLFRLNSIVDIVQDVGDNNILWCAANNGLFRFEKTTLKYEYFQSPANGTALMTINGLFMDEPNKLWMGAWGGGLISLDIPSEKWRYHTYDKPDMHNYDGKGYSDIVKSMVRKSPTELWVQTRDNGAGIFDIPSGKFQFFTPDNNNPIAIKAGTGNRLFKDNEGRVWFTFEDAGVSYINPECQAFFNIPLDLKSCGDKFSENNITDFGYDASSNKIYAAANGCTGLFEINPNDWSYKPIPTIGMEEDYQIFMTLLVTKNGDIWVGGESNKGDKNKEVKRPSLLYLDKQKGKLIPFKNAAATVLKLQQRNISDIQEGGNGIIWVATNDGALIEINQANNRVQEYTLNKENNLQKLQIQQIIYERENIWAATSKGVYQFNLKTKKFSLVEVTTDFEINAFAKDKEGVFWLGTKQNGLKKMSATADAVSTPDASHLPYTLIDKIIIGKDNELWLSTQEGIYFLNKSVKTHTDGHFQVYNKKDGLVFNSFYLHGFTALPDGTLLLGQHDQFYHILPECLTHPKTVQPVYLTSFQILGANEPTPIQQLEKVDLSHDENFFTINFSSLTYCQADKVRFTYKMEGLNKNWITTKPGETYQNYTKLDAGTYTFRIHRTGFPNEEKSLKITIHPPIWLSTGAYLLYTLLGLGGLFGIYHFQLKRQRAEQAAKNLLEIDAVKNKAYANITHEFRTPLTIILGLIDQAQKLDMSALLSTKLVGIKHNSNRILNLVNQILDLRKVEAGQFQVKFVQKEIVGLLKYTGQNFKQLATSNGIKLEQTIEFDSLVMDHDSNNLISVISNLLDNAIKFTPEGGTVSYAVKQHNKQLLITVTDTGKGISSEDLPKIFDRYIGTNAPNYTSTGIGLSLTKALVELMGGQIEVQSTVGKGSKFSVILPITRKADKAVIDNSSTLVNPVPSVNSPIILPNQPIDTESDKPIVLIVEDNLEIAQVVGGIFDNKYQLTFATDGKEGFSKAMEFIPDLIISDVMMPLMDGFELCESLKANTLTSHIPIILLTAKVADESRIAGLKRGADAYMTKPINQAELLLSVENALQSRKALKEHYYTNFNEMPSEKTKNILNIEGIDFDLEDAFIQELLNILEQKSHDCDYTIEKLWKDLSISESQLNRKLNVLLGISGGKALRIFRFHKAKMLLKTTTLTISEVAFNVGYNDSSYFSRLFKEKYKMTPSKFRKSGVGI